MGLTNDRIFELASEASLIGNREDPEFIIAFAHAVLKEAGMTNQQMLKALKSAHHMLTRDYIDDAKMKVVYQCADAIKAVDSGWSD